MNSFLEGLKLPLQLKHEMGFMHTKNDQIFQNFNLLILNSMVTCLQNMFIKPLLPHKLDLYTPYPHSSLNVILITFFQWKFQTQSYLSSI